MENTLTLSRERGRFDCAPIVGVILLGIAAVLAIGFAYPLGEGWIDEVFDGGVILLCPLAIVAAAVISGEARWPKTAAALALGAGVTASMGQLAWSALLIAAFGIAVLRLGAATKTPVARRTLALTFLRDHLACLCVLAAALLLFEVWEDLLAPGGLKQFAAEFGGWGILLSLLLLLAAANRDSLAALDPARKWEPHQRWRAMTRTLVLAVACFGAFLGIDALIHIPEIQAADIQISHAAFHCAGSLAGQVMKHVSSAGGESMTLYGLPILAAALLALRRGRALRFFAGVMLGTAGVSMAAKALLPRLRPDLVRHQNLDSFPSGHTLSATVLAGVLLLAFHPMARSAWQRTALWTAAIAWPLLMAASRVYLGRHFVTDVIGGLLLGVAWMCLCKVILIGAVHLGLNRPQEPGSQPPMFQASNA